MADDVPKRHERIRDRITASRPSSARIVPRSADFLRSVFASLVFVAAAEDARPEAALLLRRFGGLEPAARPARGSAAATHRRRGSPAVLEPSAAPASRSPPNTAAIAPKMPRRRVQVAVGRRLGARARSTRCRPSTAVEPSPLLVDDLDVLAALVGQLPRQPADRRASTMPGGRLEPFRLVALGRRLHEVRPQRHRDVGGKAVRQNRPRLIEADPDAGHELRREADEPGVVDSRWSCRSCRPPAA